MAAVAMDWCKGVQTLAPWVPVVDSRGADALLSARMRQAKPDELRALAQAWRTCDRTWVPLIFTPEANASMDAWSRFAGKRDSGGFIEFKSTMSPRIGDEERSALVDYIDTIVDAMWIGADPKVIPDPWRAAGLEALHPALANTIDASGNAADATLAAWRTVILDERLDGTDGPRSA